jgi:hypothetical protein
MAYAAMLDRSDAGTALTQLIGRSRKALIERSKILPRRIICLSKSFRQAIE